MSGIGQSCNYSPPFRINLWFDFDSDDMTQGSTLRTIWHATARRSYVQQSSGNNGLALKFPIWPRILLFSTLKWCREGDTTRHHLGTFKTPRIFSQAPDLHLCHSYECSLKAFFEGLKDTTGDFWPKIAHLTHLWNDCRWFSNVRIFKHGWIPLNNS